MNEMIDIVLSASTPTVAEGRRAVEVGMARLTSAGLDIEWGRVLEDEPFKGALGGFKGGAQVYGKLRLEDTPETVEAKVRAAGGMLANTIERFRDGSKR